MCVINESISPGNLRDPVLTNCEQVGVEVINNVATLALINNTSTVITRFDEHKSVFKVLF